MDWKTPLETLLQHALKSGASHADAVWFDMTDINISCRHQQLEALERSESKAITLRTFVGKRQAIASSTDISPDSLAKLAQNAVEMAKNTPEDPLLGLAATSLYPTAIADLDLYDAQEPEAEWLLSRAKEAENAALAVEGITNSEGADASYGRHQIGLMIASEGNIQFAHAYRASHSSLSVSVLAGSGTDMQRDYDFSTARFTHDLTDVNQLGKSAGQRAVKRLHPKKIKSGTMPVIYDSRVSKQLVSTFASAVNGQNIVRGSSFLRHDLNKKIADSTVQIIDNPLRQRGLASKPFDGEGVATKPLHLLKDGVIASWILDVRSANALHMTSTGHATRSMGSPPSPSTTNLYMEAGTQSLDELISGIEYGLYITETFGGGINIVTGDYSQGASGFLIEKGEVIYPVAEITLAGHLRDMYARMVPANDLVFRYATNAPSILIDGMAVAGA